METTEDEKFLAKVSELARVSKENPTAAAVVALREKVKALSELLEAKLKVLVVNPGDIVLFIGGDHENLRGVMGPIKEMLSAMAGGEVGLALLPDGMDWSVVSVKDREDFIDSIRAVPTGG